VKSFIKKVLVKLFCNQASILASMILDHFFQQCFSNHWICKWSVFSKICVTVSRAIWVGSKIFHCVYNTTCYAQTPIVEEAHTVFRLLTHSIALYIINHYKKNTFEDLSLKEKSLQVIFLYWSFSDVFHIHDRDNIYLLYCDDYHSESYDVINIHQ